MPVSVNTLKPPDCHWACVSPCAGLLFSGTDGGEIFSGTDGGETFSGTDGGETCSIAPFSLSNSIVARLMLSLAFSMDDMSISAHNACCMSCIEDMARLTAPVTLYSTSV